MPEINQFGSGVPGDAQVCARCEALLMDALDRTATAEDQAFFDKHLASCVGCSRMFMDAKRGAAWLEMLRDPRPEPSTNLVERILSQTSGALSQPTLVTAQPLAAPLAVVPYPTVLAAAPNILPFRSRAGAFSFRQRMLQPRLAMTAAMAFFSIALTLNLTGIRVTELRAADLRPTNIRRGFHEANAHVVRYYDNLRVVYELEARVHELQRTAEPEPDSAAPANQPAAKKPDDAPKPAKQPGPGTSLREPLFRNHRSFAYVNFPSINRPDEPETQSKGDRS